MEKIIKFTLKNFTGHTNKKNGSLDDQTRSVLTVILVTLGALPPITHALLFYVVCCVIVFIVGRQKKRYSLTLALLKKVST